MLINYSFDASELQRIHHIHLNQLSVLYPHTIKSDPLYNPVHDFFQVYKQDGFPFRFLQLLQATAIKKLTVPTEIRNFRNRSPFITASLYLALNLHHSDLEIREQFSDFSASFSHESVS